MSKHVVITGAGVLTSLGRGLKDTYRSFLEGIPKLSEISTFNTEDYASGYGGVIDNTLIDNDLDRNGKHILDRASHLVYTACKDAFLSASLYPDQTEHIDIPIYLGTTLGGTLQGQAFHRDYVRDKNKKKRALMLKDYLACNQAVNIAKRFNLTGETLILNNACASGLNALGLAFDRIRNGYENIAVAGGYDVMSEFTYAGFNSLQLVTPEKCRPFDDNRSGLVLGEGAGIAIVEELDHALKRGAHILAEIIGFGQTADAYHLTKPDPEATGASNAIAIAVNTAGIDPEEIDYINAHGTGTLANDSMEAASIIKALGRSGKEVPVSSTKPMTGHMLGAAGAAEAIFAAITINKGIIPGNLNYETPDKECGLNIMTKSEERKIKTVLTNSFGFGGSNSSMILKGQNAD